MSNFLAPSERGGQDYFVDTSGMAMPVGDIVGALNVFNKKSPISIWRSQPSVRKVTDFIAGNIASIPLHVYARTDDGRERDRESPLAKLIDRPSVAREETPYLFWKRVILDWLLWERAAVYVDTYRQKLKRIPPERWYAKVDGLGIITKIVVTDDEGKNQLLDPEDFVILGGYSGPQRYGVTPMETLSQLLEETSDALTFRQNMWRRQATHTGVVERAEPWTSQEARNNFMTSLREFDYESSRRGSTLLLDEGMVWKDSKPGFTPTDLDDIEARVLTDTEVASLFHIAPEMLGIRQGNYSNMEAFRQSLYRDNLGPYIAGWEQSLEPLVSMLGGDPDSTYIEVFLDAKLRGSFIDQAKSLTTLVGAPIMTRNEGRAKMNLPDVEGGDELITPLNVVEGGQANPSDVDSHDPLSGDDYDPTRGDPKRRKPMMKSAEAADPWFLRGEIAMSNFFERQYRTVKAAWDAGVEDWWDRERWDRELAEDLQQLAFAESPDVGRKQTESIGFDPEDYDVDVTYAYLATLAKGRAKVINQTTYEQIMRGQVEGKSVEDVWRSEWRKRAAIVGIAFVAAVASWTSKEVSQQFMDGMGFKTWIVTSGNPRDSHAMQDGETVGISEAFSNGLEWPGDPKMGAAEVANCMCGVEITWVTA